MFTSIQTALAMHPFVGAALLAKQPTSGWRACVRHESRSDMNPSLFGLFGLDRAYATGLEGGHT